MQPTLSQVELFPWYVFLIYWAISAFRVKQTKVTEELGGRLLHVAVMVLAFYLLFSERLGIGPLGSRFLPKEAWAQDSGVVLTYLGVALAIWARYSIGQYWSGRVTLKVDHQLIQSGLYGYMRHPIYTGLLLASTGTALVVGRWRCVAGLLIAIIELSRKAAKEEALLASEFGSGYEQYRQRTGFLLPRFR
jgi:protein-S-isoprenylcysteine O-methyltransferase Ste14